MNADMQVETAGFYQEAVHALQRFNGHAGAPTGPPPGLAPQTVAYNQASPVAHQDPYQCSPVVGLGSALQAALGTATGPPGPAPAETPFFAATTPPRTTQVMPRTPPKTDMPSHPGNGRFLAEKFSAKREERRSALHPFGLKPSPADTENLHAQAGTGADVDAAKEAGMESSARPPGPSQSLIDDDDEELSGAPSPGFGRLE